MKLTNLNDEYEFGVMAHDILYGVKKVRPELLVRATNRRVAALGGGTFGDGEAIERLYAKVKQDPIVETMTAPLALTYGDRLEVLTFAATIAAAMGSALPSYTGLAFTPEEAKRMGAAIDALYTGVTKRDTIEVSRRGEMKKQAEKIRERVRTSRVKAAAAGRKAARRVKIKGWEPSGGLAGLQKQERDIVRREQIVQRLAGAASPLVTFVLVGSKKAPFTLPLRQYNLTYGQGTLRLGSIFDAPALEEAFGIHGQFTVKAVGTESGQLVIHVS